MVQLKKHEINISKTARFYTLNSVQETTKNIWIVFHGYGQLAEYFIKHFEKLDPKENMIVAVEGLSRFYVNGLTGRVGASWMTKEDREAEIQDQHNYVNCVLKELHIDLISIKQRVIALGFSQGTATAVRWFVNNGYRPDQLVLWAGSFPHDVDAKQLPEIFNDLPVHFAYGHEDQFLKDVNMDEKLSAFSKMGANLQTWKFEGKHVLDKPTLQKIVDSFDD